MNNRPLYVALIPSWLAEVLARNNKPLETATRFADLETIVSLDDVCFYIQYIKNQRAYLGQMFDDMACISQHPHNQQWLANNANSVDTRAESARRFYVDPSLDLSAKQIPRVVRKTNYVPRALENGDCLAVVGVGTDTAKEFDLTLFVRSTMNELKKLRSWEELTALNVFKTFTQVATDAA